MKLLKVASLGSLIALNILSANAYDVTDRFKLIDDKFKTDAMLRPIAHDFFFDINVAVNTNVTSLIDDVDAATKASTLQAAVDVLKKYEKTEQALKIGFGLGTPLPSFTAWDTHVKPNLRAFVDVGVNIGIRSELLTLGDVINFFPEDIPADLKAFILTLSTGQDVIAQCNASSLSTNTKAFCATQPTGKYLVPNLTQAVPTLGVFGKADARVGLFNDYTYGEHFFGNFNLYAMARADIYQLITATQIFKGQSIEAPDKMNTETTVQADYRLGYKNTNYTAFLGLEELKLVKLKEAEAGSKPQTYGYDPLIRLHADATYAFSAFSLQPFAGLHKRSGYGLGDGIYAGATAGAYVWGDRLGLQLRAMADKQFLSLTPRIKLWLMQLEYTLKSPMKSTDGDVKLSAVQSVDFRIFF